MSNEKPPADLIKVIHVYINIFIEYNVYLDIKINNHYT